MALPFTHNSISSENCEIILLHKRYDPPMMLVVIIMAGVATICGIGALETTRELYVAALVVLGVFVAGVPLFRFLFFLKTEQLATPTTLLANVTYIMGYVQWPPTWPNSIIESPKRFSWAEVRHASLGLKPWVFAVDNVQLGLHLRSGKVTFLRVPRISDQEYSSLVEALSNIAKRRGFGFSTEPSLHSPLH